MIRRRSFITGLAAALCAPAIIRTPGLLMPVKRLVFQSEEKWVLAAGQELDRRVYPELFAAIGTTFGTGRNPMMFRVPDMRGGPLPMNGNGWIERIDTMIVSRSGFGWPPGHVAYDIERRVA